jgi:drug/metabolite transporter (DMT)-like permease
MKPHPADGTCQPMPPAPDRRRSAASWVVVLAFLSVYLPWGTTFFAIRTGVRHFPPALFGGARIGLAGLLLLAFLALRGVPLRLPLRELLGFTAVGLFLFVGGNWLVTLGLEYRDMESGAAAILVTTTPLWMALLEMLWPGGDRLRALGWLGLFTGLGGVLLLLPHPSNLAELVREPGPLLVLASTVAWSVGSILLRHGRRTISGLAAAAYQMAVGGGALVVIGLALGESRLLTPESFTREAVGAFAYLVVFGSLVGYVAYAWLLDHVSPALAGTYAYVNPVIAILVGWLLGGEHLTLPMLGGMAVILVSVALVRLGSDVRDRQETAKRPAAHLDNGGDGQAVKEGAAESSGGAVTHRSGR